MEYSWQCRYSRSDPPADGAEDVNARLRDDPRVGERGSRAQVFEILPEFAAHQLVYVVFLCVDGRNGVGFLARLKLNGSGHARLGLQNHLLRRRVQRDYFGRL